MTTDATPAVRPESDGFEYRDIRQVRLFRDHPQAAQFIRNPRMMSNQGFRPEEMARLRESIRSKGLTSPLLVGVLPDGSEWVCGGERRTRNIRAMLADSQPDCFNPRTKRLEVAEVVYGTRGPGVKVRLVDCEDERALAALAIQDCILNESLSDYELMTMAVDLEAANVSRKEQAKIFGLSEGWLTQTHQLAAMPQQVKDWLRDEVFGRSAGLICLQIQSGRLDDVLSQAMKDWAATTARVRAEAEEKAAAAERERGDAGVALRLGKVLGDDKTVRQASKRVETAERQFGRAAQQLKAAQDKAARPHITGDALHEAALKCGADSGITRTMPMSKLRSHVAELRAMIEADDLMNPATGGVYDRREVEILTRGFELVLQVRRDKHPLDLLVETN